MRLCARSLSTYLLIAELLFIVLFMLFMDNNRNCLEHQNKDVVVEEEVLISFEEDGRFGNLLLETATLLLLGRRVDRPVHILPQVGMKMLDYLDDLPLPMVDTRKHCVCTKCTECLCRKCNTWQKIRSFKFTNTTKIESKYVLLQYFNSKLVLSNLQEMSSMYKSFLKKSIVDQVQKYLEDFRKSEGVEFVGIHVRRTDYPTFFNRIYKMTAPVDERYFKHSMDYFRNRFENVLFFVTSDDVPWCIEKLSGPPDVYFPQLNPSTQNSPQQDFIFMTQMNHTIYDYGSFGFWTAALAGGITLVADNYSKREHLLMTAIRVHQPKDWIRIDVKQILGL